MREKLVALELEVPAGWKVARRTRFAIALFPEAAPVRRPAPDRDGSPEIVLRAQRWTHGLEALRAVFHEDPAHQGASSRAEVGAWPVHHVEVTSRTLANQPAFELVCDATLSISGTTWQERIRTLGLVHDATSYVVVAGGRQGLWTAANERAFEQCLDSLGVACA